MRNTGELEQVKKKVSVQDDKGNLEMVSPKPSCLIERKEDLIQTGEACHLVTMKFFCVTSESKTRMKITRTFPNIRK